jgi:hypothetical protein
LQCQFGFTIEEVHALLIELEPTCSSDSTVAVGGKLMLTSAPDRNTCTKVTSPVGSTV